MSKLPEFTDFASVAAHLRGLGFFYWDLSLERIGRTLHWLEDLVPAMQRRPAAAHIVGTNGKGSTATFLAALGRAHGLRAGLYTSPHFLSVRERILVDGRLLPEDEWVVCANFVRQAGGESLTYFEFVTALAAVAFARAGVDLAVWEAGLGARSDAVTALPVDLVLFTPIGLDHENILGEGLAAIARDKADALVAGRGIEAAVTAGQEPAVLEILQHAAERLGCPLLTPSEVIVWPEGARLGLAGAHQQDNAYLALAGWRWLVGRFGFADAEARRLDGLRRAFIPGRLQFIPSAPERGLPALILDGAHNAHGLRALHSALRQMGIRPGAVIFSALADKDMRAAGAALSALTAGPIFVPPVQDNPRAAKSEDLVALLGPRAQPAADLNAALSLAAAATSDPILVCGSLYLLGEFYTLHPEYLEPSPFTPMINN